MDDFDFSSSARADAGDFNYPIDAPGPATKKTGKKKAPPVRPTATYADTPEQTDILHALAMTPPGQVLKVVSYSGTGKTSTAIRLTEAYPDLVFFYLAYNADIAKDAKKRFPENTVVKTTHGWAFGVIGVKDWLNVKRLGNIRRWELAHWMKARRLDPKLPTGASLHVVAADVLATVRRFTQSADPVITRRHAMPDQDKTDKSAFLKVALRQAPDAPTAERNGAAAFVRYRDWLAEKAQTVWQSLIDPEDGSLPLEHDVYLKLLQLQGATTDYHVVIMDECQDANACVMDLFVKQPGIQVAIYDPNQAIYQFRGARDLASGLPGTQKPLSQSFRFGDAIAGLANRVLAYQPAHYGGFVPLRGTPSIDSRIGTIDLPPYTVICRSNRGVFEQALIAVQAGLRINSGARDLETAIGYVESAWSLLTGTRIPKMDSEMQEFADGETLREESKADPSLKWVVKLCDEHVDNLPGLCEKLRAAKTHQKRTADVLLITAHRCVHPDTLVETPTGLTAIKNIPDCGMIATPFGQRDYQDKFIREKSETLIITTKKGYSIEVTPDHGMTVLDQHGFLRVEAGKLKSEDLLCLRIGAILDHETAPEIQVAAFQLDSRAVRFSLPTQMSDELAEFLGLMVADGSVFRRGFRMTKRHQDVLDRFCQLTEALFGYRAILGDNEGTACYTVHSVHIARWLLALGGLSPHAKGIPDCILASPLKLQAAFLRGLFEDGTVNIKQERIDHIHFETKYPEIAKTIQIMLLRFGIIATRKERTSSQRYIVSLYIYGDNMLVFREKIGFISQFKNERLDHALPVTRCNDLILVSNQEIELLRKRIGFYDFQNVRSRKTVSRHKARQFLAQNPDDPEMDWLASKLQWHYDPIVSIEKSASETMCVTVPDGARFLQNGFDGWNSKGLEFNQVRLANDFTALDNDLLRAMDAMRNSAWTDAETILQKLPVAELNLLYVALTRARVTLQPNQTLEFLDALTPVLARLQAKSGTTSVTDDRPGLVYASTVIADRPPPPAPTNPDAYRRAQEHYQAFLPDLQDALKMAALRDHWTQADWIEHVESIVEGLEESGYCPAWIQAAANLYRATPKNSSIFA